jgi:dienelactone hydrolase
MTSRLLHTGFIGLLVCLLSACAFRPPATWDERHPERLAALAAAVPMPADEQLDIRYFSWTDESRTDGSRSVPAKLYLPMPLSAEQRGPLPLIVFSHGLGGSREGYSYLGKYWALHGYASLHVQHTGSDRSLWAGNALELISRLQQAAQEKEALARVADIRFALNQVLAEPGLRERIDATRIGMAGHSYGANTGLLISGATPPRNGAPLNLREPRITATVLISAPPFYGASDQEAILQSVRVPTLHITATQDEITIPGYFSGISDRLAIYSATGSPSKSLVVFRDGSHSMFTDRLNTGGEVLNPRVKQATRELTLAFFDQWLKGREASLSAALRPHTAWIARQSLQP